MQKKQVVFDFKQLYYLNWTIDSTCKQVVWFAAIEEKYPRVVGVGVICIHIAALLAVIAF